MRYHFEFGTFLVYATKRNDENSKRSITIAHQFKNASPIVLNRLIETLDLNRTFFSELLNTSSLLVPVPTSSITNLDHLWPGLEICKKLCDNNFGSSFNPLLKREYAVRKSSTSRPENRLSCKEHYKSFSVKAELINENQIVLVDDVFSKGNTSVACAIKLKQTYPDKTIKIFSVMRTRSFINSLPNIIVPEIQILAVDNNGIVRLPD